MLSFRLSHQILSLIRDILVMFKIMPFGFKLRNRISRDKKEVKNGILINSSIISSLNRKSWGKIYHERNYKYIITCTFDSIRPGQPQLPLLLPSSHSQSSNHLLRSKIGLVILKVRQRGRVVSAWGAQCGSPWFESHSDHIWICSRSSRVQILCHACKHPTGCLLPVEGF